VSSAPSCVSSCVSPCADRSVAIKIHQRKKRRPGDGGHLEGGKKVESHKNVPAYKREEREIYLSIFFFFFFYW
jgi:hypothetical protein